MKIKERKNWHVYRHKTRATCKGKKINFTIQEAMRAQQQWSVIAKWGGWIMPIPGHCTPTSQKTPSTHCTGSLLGLEAGLDGKWKFCTQRVQTLDRLAHSKFLHLLRTPRIKHCYTKSFSYTYCLPVTWEDHRKYYVCQFMCIIQTFLCQTSGSIDTENKNSCRQRYDTVQCSTKVPELWWKFYHAYLLFSLRAA